MKTTTAFATVRIIATLTAIVLTTVLGTHRAYAGIIALEWASALDSSSNVINPSNTLGAPDGSLAEFGSGSPATATFSGFGNGSSTNTDSISLAALLGIPEATLSQADLITFEHNGTPNVPFESGTWTFDDGSSSIQIFHDFDNPMTGGGIVALGNITRGDYATFFGFTDPFSSGDIPFLLFDLGGLDLASNNFDVTIDSQGVGIASPDLDVLGIIIPEPSSFTVSTIGMLICGVWSMIGRTRDRRIRTRPRGFEHCSDT